MELSKHQYIRFGQLSFAILLGLLFFAIWEPENKIKYPVWEASTGYPVIVQFPNGKFGIKQNEFEYIDLNGRFKWKKGTPFFYDCQGSRGKVFSVWEQLYAEIPDESKIFSE